MRSRRPERPRMARSSRANPGKSSCIVTSIWNEDSPCSTHLPPTSPASI